MENLTADNPTATTTDNPSGTGGGVSNGTGATNGQAQGGAPTDDIFKGIDPSRLPPEAKQYYDSMLKDYREKTSRISETTKSEVEKAVQAYKEKATQYDQIANEPSFVDQWNAYVKKSQESAPGAEASGDPVLNKMKEQLQQMEQKFQMTEMAQITESFAEAVNEKGEKIHPDFDQLNEISVGEIPGSQGAEPFSLLRASIELAPGKSPSEKLANGYKMAKAAHDKIFEMGKKAGMGRLQNKVLNSSLPPSNSGADVLNVTDKKPRNAHEALAMAKRGQIVSRD